MTTGSKAVGKYVVGPLVSPSMKKMMGLVVMIIFVWVEAVEEMIIDEGMSRRTTSIRRV